MEFIVCVETRLDGRVLSVDEVMKIDRPSSGFRPEELGLTLAHGKAVLHEIQKVVVAKQIMTLSVAERICGDCGQRRSIKDARTKRLRSIFGVMKVSSHRLLSCNARRSATR